MDSHFLHTAHRRAPSFVCWLLPVALLASGVVALAQAAPAPGGAPGTDPAALANRSRLPLGDPLVSAAARIQCNRANSWNQDSARLLLLEGDVSIALGAYGFRADRAVVRIDDETHPGKLIHHLSMYLDNARPLRGGAVWAEAPRLLVTASTTGNIQLDTNALLNTGPVQTPLVFDAEARIQRYLAAVTRPPLAVPTSPVYGPEADALRLARRARIDQELIAQEVHLPPSLARQPQTQPALVATTQGAPGPAPTAVAQPIARPVPEAGAIMPARGILSYSASKYVFQEGKNGAPSALSLVGNVRVIYQSPADKRSMVLQAENAVIFLTGSLGQTVGERRVEAQHIQGLYLEEDVVITDGLFTVRAPRVYYDLTRNKAVLLEAVLFTWDVKHQVPLYVRAQQLRQDSHMSWSAQNALLTTSEFAEPHVAIAAAKVTVTEVNPAPGGGPAIPGAGAAPTDGGTVNLPGNAAAMGWAGGAPTVRFRAEDVTVRALGVPVFYWPSVGGDTVNDVPIQDVTVGFSNQNGPFVRTRWDLFALAGQPRPDGVNMTGQVDYLGDHGPATGLDLGYNRPSMYGYLNSFLVPIDQGNDDIGGRDPIPHDSNTRGFALWRHRQYLDDHWQLSLEFAYVSDPTFLEEYERGQAESSKPYETSAYLKRQENDWAFTLLTSYDLNNFTPQTTVLQTPGYTVEKVPELGYYRVGTSLWGDRLTYYTQNTASRMLIHPGSDTPAQRGFTDLQSLMLFGIPRTVAFDTKIEGEGVPTDWVLRADSRHEIQAPMKLGIFDVTPYVAGRITGYNTDFQLTGHAEDGDPVRLWGGPGARIHTQFSRSYDSIDSQILDVHRLRHIIEPSADLAYFGVTSEAVDYPIYDQDVEDIASGGIARLGLRNTLQTQRGGPGRWRSVDWIVLDTDLVGRTNTGEVPDLVPRFFSYRPEYGLGGNHFYSHLLWMVSDTFATVGELTYDLDNERVAQWRAGAVLRQTPRLRTFIDYDQISVGNATVDSELLSFGFTYQLTPKYLVGLRQVVDIGRGEMRGLDVTLERRLPRWRLILTAGFDQIDHNQSIGFLLVPEGVTTGRLLSPLLGEPLPE